MPSLDIYIWKRKQNMFSECLSSSYNKMLSTDYNNRSERQLCICEIYAIYARKLASGVLFDKYIFSVPTRKQKGTFGGIIGLFPSIGSLIVIASSSGESYNL